EVRGYKVYRSGLFLKEVKTTNTFDISNNSPHKFCYSVSAIDSSGNESAQSEQVCISDPILKPYKYLGAFVPGWHWGQWSEVIDDDLIQAAKKNGITVFHLMLPYFEYPLGTYREGELGKLDHFLDIASKNNTYAMISFIHAYGITLSNSDPYYHPAGIEGLMFDERLKIAFKNRIRHIIKRRNSVNGKLYKEDPTILAWIVCDEPISAPFNYSVRPPDITAAQFKSWLEEMTSYIKGLDPNHLVTVFIQPAFSTLKEGDWVEALNLSSLDFIYGEDADMRVLNYFPHLTDQYSSRLFELNKPVVVMLSFTSGEWDQASICKDYNFQADLLEKAINRYFDLGARGLTIFSWGSKLYSSIPSYDQCFNYNEENAPICTVLKKIGSTLNQ
ncbi:MAG: hypothetical protein QXH91_05815, partial [Candidatus Bathyarchaeia archaeon]